MILENKYLYDIVFSFLDPTDGQVAVPAGSEEEALGILASDFGELPGYKVHSIRQLTEEEAKEILGETSPSKNSLN
jgi:hypothetical protein